jgi:capsular polysaccharide biosynthesis protein
MTDFPRSFKAQLELFASHGVIVAPHGAGLANSLYLAPGSSIIEVYPYHFDHNLYRIISTVAGVGHFPVYTFNGSDTWSGHKVPFPCPSV